MDDVLPEGSRRNSSSGFGSPRPPTPPKKRSDTRYLSPADLLEILLSGNCEKEVALRIVSDYTASNKRLRTSAAADSKCHVPSDLTIWSGFRKYVAGAEPVFKCHRPFPPPIPLVLLHRAFARFYDDVKKEPDAADRKFACEYWADLNSDNYVENHRQAAGKLGRKVSRYFNQGFDFSHSGFGVFVEGILEDNSRMDVQHLKGRDVVVLEEYKPQPAAGEPSFQNMECFRRVWGGDENEAQGYAILVNISGPQLVEVMAASLQEGNRVVWAESLAKFSCHHTAEGRLAELEHTARIWKAVKGFVVSWERERKQGERPLPWCVRGLRNVTPLDEKKLVYTYDEALEGGGTRKVLAKVTERYSKESHAAWQSVAPELYRVEDVACLGWKVVHMEYLEPSVWKSAVDVVRAAADKPELLDRLKTLIRNSAEVWHRKGFVHGDFRLDNLLLRQAGVEGGFQVRVVDFDWAGKDGEAKYPVLLNPAVRWHKDAFWGHPIIKEHDLWFTEDGLLPQGASFTEL